MRHIIWKNCVSDDDDDDDDDSNEDSLEGKYI